MAADVAGSCRLIGMDEEGTLGQLKALREILFDPKVTDHRGRIVKNTGDGALVMFASVVDAVRCADEIQRGVAEQNINVPQSERIEFRIGIHVGDIIVEETDILVTRSISRCVLRALRSRAEFAFPTMRAGRSGPRSVLTMMIWVLAR